MQNPILDPSKAFLGVGWAYPLNLAADNSISTVAYEEDIRQAVQIILGTNPGERVMRPDFGAGLNALQFEPINTTTMALTQDRVRNALINWEPRIDLEEVTVTADRAEVGKLLITIRYTVRATSAHHNLVYPFYLQEGTAQ